MNPVNAEYVILFGQPYNGGYVSEALGKTC